MECEHAYTKPGVRFILCRKCAAELKPGGRQAEAHALCGHQRFCPNKRACTLLPSWKDCVKRRETREEAAETKIPAKKGTRKGKEQNAKQGK